MILPWSETSSKAQVQVIQFFGGTASRLRHRRSAGSSGRQQSSRKLSFEKRPVLAQIRSFCEGNKGSAKLCVLHPRVSHALNLKWHF